MARNREIAGVGAQGEWCPRRVVVDAVSTTRQMSGVGHYTAGCVSALIERLPDTEFHLFLGWSWSATLPQVRSGESDKSVNLFHQTVVSPAKSSPFILVIIANGK